MSDDIAFLANASRATEAHFSIPLDGQDHRLGMDDLDMAIKAKRAYDAGTNPADWVQDEGLWERAKEAARKSYSESDDFFWSAVVAIYKNMGGGIKANEKAVSELFLCIFNEALRQHGAGGWVQIVPYGTFDHSDGVQKFTKDDAEKIVTDFTAHSSARLMGLPWYIGHPDHPKFSDVYRDKKAYGRIKMLEARTDGLWANVRWNPEGKKLIEDEAFHGHSVNWGVIKKDNYLRPVALKSVGFTNEPNIGAVMPIMAANEKDTTMNKRLRELLGLPESATDDQVTAALEKNVANAKETQTKLDAAENKLKELGNIANEKKEADKQNDEIKEQLKTLKIDFANAQESSKTALEEEKKKIVAKETELANERKAHAKSVVTLAIAGGCITAADQKKWEQDFVNDHGGTVAKVAALKPIIHTHSHTMGRRDTVGTPTDKRATFLANVKKRMRDGGLSYDQAFGAESREHPELLATAAS